MTTLIFWIWLVISTIMAIWTALAIDTWNGSGERKSLESRIMSAVIMFAFWPVILTIIAWSLRSPENEKN